MNCVHGVRVDRECRWCATGTEPAPQVAPRAQVNSRAKAAAARRIVESLEEKLSKLGPRSVSLLDDYHGNQQLIIDILNEELP